MELFFIEVLKDFLIALVVGMGWAVLFGTSRRVLWVAGLLGGLGHVIRFILVYADLGLISATLAGAIFIGVVGIFMAHRVDQPPVVFTMPACITMIPGMYAYRTMLGGIKSTDSLILLQDPTILPDMVHNFMLTVSLLFTLAIGISIGVLLFRKESSRYISIKEITKLVE